MESDAGDVDTSELQKLYTARVVEELEIEKAKVAKLEAQLSKCSINPGAGDGPQIVEQEADLNPLLLETVLEQLSDYLDHTTKASGRLVCHKWNEIITPEFLSESKLTLDYSSYVDKEIDNMALSLSSAFPESEIIPPCVDLKFKPSKHHRGTRMLLKRLSSFGQYINELTLRTTTTNNYIDRIAQDLFFDILNLCNDLEALVIPCPAIEPFSATNSNVLFPQIKSLQIGDGGEDEIYLIPVINSILKLAPNLRKLRLTTINTEEGDILSSFNTCRDSGYLEYLVELVLGNSFVTSASLISLSQYQFKCLKTLSLETPADTILDFQTSAALTTLLANLSLFLEKLTLGMEISNEEEEEGVSLTIESIPRMECLKKFSFTGQITPEQGSINEIMDKFPKLETLFLGECSVLNDFEGCGVANRLFPENLAGGLQYFALQNLWIPNLPIKNYETRENCSQIEIIARCFPELQNLGIGFNLEEGEFFETFISHISLMSQLTELTIAFEEISESEFNDCVSGMFKDQFHGLKSLKFLNYDDYKINLNSETVKKGFENAPSLTDLTFRYFSIKANEKQEIFQTLSKIKRVCFRKCTFEEVPIDQDYARALKLPSTSKTTIKTEEFAFGISTGLDLGY